MKYYFVFIFFCNSFLYSQTNEKIDSIKYYSNLANSNIKADNYTKALFYTQKAINYSKTVRNPQEQADQTFRLGKIYYDLKKYNDAIENFHKSISIYKNLKPSATYAYAYYYLSVCFIEKANFINAEICFNEAQSIFNEIKIPDPAEQFNLQKGIINKSKGNYDLASTIFKTIIAKPDSPSLLNTKAEASYQIGKIEASKNRNNLALNYLNKAFELNNKTENLEQKSNILLALSDVYEKTLDKNNAYSYLKQHLNLKERSRRVYNY